MLDALISGKLIKDARTAELTANREAVIKRRIDDIQTKLDSYLRPKNDKQKPR